MRRLIASAALVAALVSAPAAVAVPQLPAGVSVQDIVGAPVSVPAGETTTVDFGVPVSVNYSADGWAVVSSGTSVSVTAPAGGGSTAAVPVSAAGRNATLTLVSEGSAGARETELAPAPDPQQDPERIDLEASVTGRQIVSTLGLRQALALFSQFRNVSQDGLKLRYLDVDGRLIEGVERDVDEVSRTLTLTYPEGEIPDNPFIIEVVRDDATAVAVVTLTAPDHTRAEATSPEASQQVSGSAERDNSGTIGLGVAGGVVVAALVLGVVSLLVRKRR